MRNFEHQTCVYGSDEEFLAMAVPFVEGALHRADPVLVTTTPHNLELLGSVLGPGADRVDYAETAYFGRRPSQRVAAFHRWWRRGSAAGGRPRILAEPVWSGRSTREILAWRRMESGLNEILAGTGLWMICPYDARTVPAKIVAESLRTHPACVRGGQIYPSGSYVAPGEFARRCDADPLPAPPPGAAEHSSDGDLRAVRRFIAGQASERGLPGERAALFVVAVSEATRHILEEGTGRATIHVWERFGAILCQIHAPGAQVTDLFLGFHPPLLERARPGDGMWLTRQICDFVDVRADEEGCSYRLQVPSGRAVE